MAARGKGGGAKGSMGVGRGGLPVRYVFGITSAFDFGD